MGLCPVCLGNGTTETAARPVAEDLVPWPLTWPQFSHQPQLQQVAPGWPWGSLGSKSFAPEGQAEPWGWTPAVEPSTSLGAPHPSVLCPEGVAFALQGETGLAFVASATRPCWGQEPLRDPCCPGWHGQAQCSGALQGTLQRHLLSRCWQLGWLTLCLSIGPGGLNLSWPLVSMREVAHTLADTGPQVGPTHGDLG